MYLVNTMPDICYAVNTLSQFMVEPKRAHWATAKHVLRYLQGTINYGLLYTKSKDIGLSGFTDADWAGSSVDQKNTMLGGNTNNNIDAEGVAVQMQCWEEGSTTTRMQRELQYRCSSGSGRAMGNSTGCNNVEDVGQEGQTSAQARILIVLDKNRIKDYALKVVDVPVDADPPQKYEEAQAKAKCMILDGVKDHVVPHIAEKDTTREMWEMLTTLYQGTSVQRKMLLENQLRQYQM
eukprot:PITA_04485